MALKFTCPNCGSDIYVKYIRPGEMAECRSCGTKTIVPETSDEAEAPPDYLGREDSASKVTTPAPEPARYECPRCKTLCAEGTEVCPICNLRFSTISLYSPKWFVLMSMLFSFVVPAYLASANWGRLGNQVKRKTWLFGSIAGLVGVWVLLFNLEDLLGIDAEEGEHAMRYIGRVMSYGINLPLGYLLKQQQQPLFKRGMKLGMKPASLWKGIFKGIGLVAVAFVVSIVLAVLVGGDRVTEAYDLLEKERYEEAAAAFDSLLTDYPDDTDFLWYSAVCHAACREFAAAGVSMEAYVGQRPEDARGYVMLGAIRREQGLVYEGVRLFEIADSLEPGILEEWLE